MLRGLALSVAVAAAACGGVEPSPNPGAADAAAACSIAIDGPSVLDLAPSERRGVRVRLTGARAGEALRLGLVGSALDASLDRTAAAPDDSGAATFQLTAPSSAAAFRLRATAGCGAEAWVDVRVDAAGSGAVDVGCVYRGARGPTAITVDLLRGDDCDPAGTATITRTASLPSQGGAVRFSGLAVGATYSLRGTALGRDRAPVADACAGPFRVAEGESRPVTLSFTDRASTLGARYDATVTFDLGELAARSAARWIDGARAELAMYGGEAMLFAPELAEAAAMSVPAELAPAARAAVTNALRGELGAQLEATLARRGARVELALQRLAEPTAAGLARTRLSATLLRPATEGGDWTVRDIALRLDPATPDVDGDDATVSLDQTATARLGRSGGDNIVASVAALPLPYARVARRTLGAVAQRFGVASTGEYVALGACPVVASLLAPTSALCDEPCRVAACRRSADRIGRAFDDAVARTDLARASVDLRFAAAGRVAPGTLRIDRVESLAAGSFREEPETVVVASVALTAAATP